MRSSILLSCLASFEALVISVALFPTHVIQQAQGLMLKSNYLICDFKNRFLLRYIAKRVFDRQDKRGGQSTTDKPFVLTEILCEIWR